MTPLRTQQWWNDLAPSAAALADGATINWDLDSGHVATVTLGGNRTLAVPTNGQDNVLYLLRVTQDGTGSRTLTLDASIDRGGLARADAERRMPERWTCWRL